MHKGYRTLNKIVKNEGGEVIEIKRKDRMDKVKIDFGNYTISYNFSASKHCNMEKIVKSQIRKLRQKIA